MKTIVIGLDGASWDLIGPWIENGDLPNLKLLRENGSWGVSQSWLPAVTCPNWKCYSTGKNPGKLGVFWFQQLDREKKKIIGFNSRSFKSPEIFDHIGKAGLKVGVVNMATTYPPKELNGFMISGPPDSEYTGYTYPGSLEDELKSKYDYHIYPRGHIASKKDIEEYFDDILDLINLRFKVAKDILERVDFLHVSVFYINVLHHFLYDEERVKLAWKVIDNNIGDFISEENRIVLLSDHGTNEIKFTFFINTWLEKQGYLKVKSSFLAKTSKLGFTKQNLLRVTNRLGLTNLFKSSLPEKLKRSIPSEDGTRSGTLVLTDHVDLKKSKAIGVGQGLIYLLNYKNPEEYNRLREEIMDGIKELSFNGLKVANKVLKKEEVYTGKYLDKAPDIVFEEADHVYSSTGIGKDKIFDERSDKWKAENHRNGIFLIYGKGIKKGVKIEGIKITDIAPTILEVLRLPIPQDMDGKPISDVMDDKNQLDKNPMTDAVLLKNTRRLKKLREEFQGL